eukprot:2613685-Pyramimonas_sp.AAC.1
MDRRWTRLRGNDEHEEESFAREGDESRVDLRQEARPAASPLEPSRGEGPETLRPVQIHRGPRLPRGQGGAPLLGSREDLGERRAEAHGGGRGRGQAQGQQRLPQ